MADNNKTGTGLHRCSFCGRTEQEVNYLIPSQSGVYICDNCVFACSQLIDDYERASLVRASPSKGDQGGSG